MRIDKKKPPKLQNIDSKNNSKGVGNMDFLWKTLDNYSDYASQPKTYV